MPVNLKQQPGILFIPYLNVSINLEHKSGPSSPSILTNNLLPPTLDQKATPALELVNIIPITTGLHEVWPTLCTPMKAGL